MELLCERIKRLREERKLTKTAVALKLNVSNVAVGYWEDATRVPSGKRISLLASILGVTTDYLLNGREAARLAALEHAVLSCRAPDPKLVAMVRARKMETA